ncbi:MAG: serpin family protein [Eubacteriales bacterium]|nr:serpin family protein [Eubacteriales bacterium]
MKNKKLLAFLLTGALLAQASLLGGCAAGGASRGAQAESTTAGTAEEGTTAADTAEGTVESTAEGTAEGSKESGTTAGQEQAAYTDGANGFALRLTAQLLAQKQEGENLIASPYSVWLPLAALAGASDEQAQQELLQVLGEAGIDAETLGQVVQTLNSALTQEERKAAMEEAGETFDSPLKIANALFVSKDSTVNPDFADRFAGQFAGKLFPVDFSDDSAADEVNAWAEEQTEGKITELIDSFDPDTVAAIANALYFSDSWAEQFVEENTADAVFHGAKGDKTVPFMNQKLDSAVYYEDGQLQAVVLNTANGGQMTLVLPGEGQTAEQALESLDAETLQKIQSSEGRTVQLSLPKFHLESGVFSVKEALESLGVPLTDAQNPHLTGLVENESLYLSQAVQKAMVEADEKGLTAAAVTVMAISRMSLAPETEPVELTFDKPFAFVLSADGGEAGQQVLFTGVVNQID